MLQKRKLLFLTDVFPFPLDRGQRVRVGNLVAACSRAFDVTFVGPGPNTEGERRAMGALCARAVYVSPPAARPFANAPLRAIARAIGAAPGVPQRRTVASYLPFVEALAKLDLRAFDFIWAERLHIARLCKDTAARTIVDLDDLEHVKLRRQLRLKGTAASIAHNAYRYALYRSAELHWSKRFLASVVCSDTDRDYLASHGCRDVVTIPNGVHLPAGPPAKPRRAAETPLRIAFLGNTGYPPNADAIEFFATHIVPELRQISPAATFDVIGPGASPELSARYGSRVHFRGFVDDLGAALADYDLLAAPIRFGGGTKLKVLDAMANRLPVVTTKIGAEGLSLEDGTHVLLAESAAEFASQMVRIKSEPALASKLAENAYELTARRFSWEKIQSDVGEWLLRLESRR